MARAPWRELRVSLLLLLFASPLANATPIVWYTSDGGATDFLDLFRQPPLWQNVRPQVNVYKFYLQQLSDSSSLASLSSANAFGMLSSYGVKTAVEAPAIKEWDCTGTTTLAQATQAIANVKAMHGTLNGLAMDEPLFSGTGACGLTIAQTATRVAKYVASLRTNAANQPPSGVLAVGDIEPYPSFSVSQLEAYVDTLIVNAARPAFFHVDVNVAYTQRTPSIDVGGDLKALRTYLASHGIAFGIIFSPGYDPVSSDQSYYNHVMDWVNQVRFQVGVPDHAIFQSWVKRAPASCDDTLLQCGACRSSDPPACGQHSVPINLPDSDPSIFSHTRLIGDGLGFLQSAPSGAPPSFQMTGKSEGLYLDGTGAAHLSGWACEVGLSYSTQVNVIGQSKNGLVYRTIETDRTTQPNEDAISQACATSATGVAHRFSIKIGPLATAPFRGGRMKVQVISPLGRAPYDLPTASGDVWMTVAR